MTCHDRAPSVARPEVELNKARTASQQHQGEFEARSREQETKIGSAQKALSGI